MAKTPRWVRKALSEQQTQNSKKKKWFEDENPAPKEKKGGGFDNPLNTWKRGDTGWERNDTKPEKKETTPSKDGVWRTVRGRHVFIEEGKTLEQALGHKPGVENQKKLEKLDRKIASVKKHQAKIDAEVADGKRKKKYFL